MCTTIQHQRILIVTSRSPHLLIMSYTSSFTWKKAYRDANGARKAENSPYTMNIFALDEYGNGAYYPETEYDSESKVWVLNDLMAYAMKRNDYACNTTQLNLANYCTLYPLIYFNVNYQVEQVTQFPPNNWSFGILYQLMQLRISKFMLSSFRKWMVLLRLLRLWPNFMLRLYIIDANDRTSWN